MLQNLLKYFYSFVLCAFLLFPEYSFAQLTGTKTIPGDYATIELAIADLNLLGVGAGGVTFNVSAGHTETFSGPTVGTLTATGTQANQIVFQKSGVGANPLITAGLNGTTTNLDGIIKIVSGDYITFDGIDLQENSGNVTATTQMEWGYGLVKKDSTDGCWYVTIKNSAITLNRLNTASAGIYSANHGPTSTTFFSLADSSGTMRYGKFFNNTISNVYWGIRLRGSTNALFYDQNNEIGVSAGNTITNFGGSTASAYGIEVEYQNNIKIANNTLNGGGPGQTGVLYGIRTGSGTNSNADVYRNNLTLIQGGTSLIYGITNSTGSSGIDNTINIYENTVENCLQPNSTTNNVWLIYNLASAYNVNIYGNTIRNNTKSAGTGIMYCIYNTPTSAPMNVKIYNNEIYNNFSAGPIHGIFADDGTNLSIYANNIYDLRSAFTSTTALATAGITIASGPINTHIYNNFISDLKAVNSAYTIGIRGINITSTTANSNIGLYYNTIFLNASGGTNFGTAGIFHTYSATATSAVLDMRNNIVVNLSTSNGTGKTVAFRRSAATNLNNYSSLSNNNSFYSGTPGINNVIFFDGTNFDETILAFKTRVDPRESFSFTENVPFVNNTTAPYNLHVRTDVGTQTEGGGLPVTTPVAITTDFDGNVRNASTPDVGADEFNGMGSDITPPFISYVPLSHTISTANRNLDGAVITDGSGVNTTPGTAPRIYFKRASDSNTYIDNTSSTNGWKYTETISASTPFDFVINYSLLFGGTGAQSGDTVQYFVVAQDLFSPANVGISEGTFAATPSSVNLTAAAFPLTGTINQYRIIYLLNGTITVGTGGNYPNLTGSNGFFTAVNENIVSGNIAVQVISDITEPGIRALNQWVEDGIGNYTITIQPDAAVVRTLSGSSSSPGLITLNGADRVIIDGRFNGSGNYLSFQNTNTAANTTTIHLISLGVGAGANDVTIRNSIIKAGSNTVSNVFGIFVGATTLTTSSSGGADNHNLTLRENIVALSRIGIFVRGTTSNPLNNLVVSGNIVGSNNPAEYITEYGINIQSAAAPQVTYNEVYNLVYDVSKWGIYFGSYITNAVVSKNRVHSIDQPGTSGFNSVGIYFASSTGCSDNQIDNNMVYNLNTYGNVSMYLVGIRIVGGTNYKIYYNSVSIAGAFANTASGLVSSCLYISSASTNMDVRNNIFLNTRTGTDPKNYTIHSPNTTTFSLINHNDYWATGNVIGYFGADVATFNDWQTIVGQDANSMSIDPMFTSATDLHINAGTTPILLESGGALISGITTDFDDDVRPGPAGSVNGGALAPDLGADEFDGVPVGGATFQLSVDVTNGWNMVSIPGLHPVNQDVTTWWSGKDPAAGVFRFSGGYLSITTATPSVGYWMKHIGANTYNTGDEWPAGGIQIVANTPISGATGWNLIGGFHLNVLTSGITTTPPGLRTGSVFQYAGGYTAAANLVPGYGYWIKLTAPGLINIPTAFASGPAKIVETNKEDWGKIIITDNSGKSYTLYAVNGKVNISDYELPPAPPAGMFDVRFGSDRYAEELSAANQTIELSGMEYPVTVRVENASIKLQDETGKTVNARMKSGEEVVINSSLINKLLVSANIIPDVYALEQNYPNPFNPSTVIEFSLPEDVNNATLTIYNALGQRVAELINSKLEAGKYSYLWNVPQSGIATGMYIYELRTDKFVSVKKMLFLK